MRWTRGIALGLVSTCTLVLAVGSAGPVTAQTKPESKLKFALYLTIDRVRFAGIWDYVWPSGVGPRVAEPAFLLIDPYPWSAPYEELRLKE